jgi:hypothetical protein
VAFAARDELRRPILRMVVAQRDARNRGSLIRASAERRRAGRRSSGPSSSGFRRVRIDDDGDADVAEARGAQAGAEIAGGGVERGRRLGVAHRETDLEIARRTARLPLRRRLDRGRARDARGSA